MQLKGSKEEIQDKLKKMANSNCKKCYGLGYKGFYSLKKKFIGCKCLIPERLNDDFDYTSLLIPQSKKQQEGATISFAIKQ